MEEELFTNYEYDPSLYSMDLQDAEMMATTSMLTGAFSVVFFLISLFIGVITIISWWKIFTKAGREGWKSLIPIYNLIVLLEIAHMPLWWVVLFFIPVANFIALIMLNNNLAKTFGKSSAFGLGLTFLGFIFYPILAFGPAQYSGNQNSSNEVPNTSSPPYSPPPVSTPIEPSVPLASAPPAPSVPPSMPEPPINQVNSVATPSIPQEPPTAPPVEPVDIPTPPSSTPDFPPNQENPPTLG